MLNKLFGRSVTSKVTSMQKKSTNLLGMFAKTNAKLEKVNTALAKTAEDARRDAEELLAEATRADAHRQANVNVQEKLKDFIPQV